MAMKESNKDRSKRLAKEKALDNMVKNAEELELTYDKPTSGVEGWISQDAFPRPDLQSKHFKWIAIGVGVAVVALFIL
jgi:hypothetical protein